MKKRIVFIWVAYVHMLSIFILHNFLEKGDNQILRVIGLVNLVIAVAFIFPPFYQLKKYGKLRPGGTYMNSTVVADRGLYAILRHPQYLGYIFIALELYTEGKS